MPRFPNLCRIIPAIAGIIMLAGCTGTRPSVEAPPVEGAHLSGNKACAECHSKFTRIFQSSPHARIQVTTPTGLTANSGCESCHGPGSRHIEAGGGRRFIVNPRRDPTACLACHQQVEGEFHLPHHHAVLEQRMNCVQCHDPHGADIHNRHRGLAMARLNETCGDCHREQARPHVFEHEALREGCTACHQPHGSVNRKLLTEADPNLCLKCHAQVAGNSIGSGELYIGKVSHTLYLKRGTCWSAGCHTAVHGSNINPRMLY